MDTFDLNRLQQEAQLEHVEFHETLDSTNKLAAELLPDLRTLCPALVLTETQTDGRGRGSNSWWASTGALTFSLILDAKDTGLPPSRLPLLSLAVGVAVRNVIAALLPEANVQVKWPNDIMINESKVCGILTEHRSCDGQSMLIAGVGINVNNSLDGAPVDVRQRATSIHDVSGESYDLTTILIDTLNAVQAGLARLRIHPEQFMMELNQHSLLNGRLVTIEAGQKVKRGQCIEINQDGALLLETTSGPETLFAGTIIDW